LRNAALTDKTMRWFSACEALETLALGGNRAGDEVVPWLNRNPQIYALDLTNTQVTGQGIAGLELPNLQNLYIHQPIYLGEAAITKIRHVRGLALEDVKLCGGAAYRLSLLSGLSVLCLNNSGISDGDVAVLIQSQSVETLSLIANAKITDASIEHFLKMPKLTGVELLGTAITLDGVARLRSESNNRIDVRYRK
jgi:hypothetical protein